MTDTPEENNKEESNKIENALAKFEKLKQAAVTGSKKLKIVAAGVFLVFVVMGFFPMMIDNTELRVAIEAKAKEILQSDIQVNGDVKFSLVPFPSVTLENVLVKGFRPKESERVYNIFIKSLKFKFSLFNHDKITGIEVRYPILQSYFFQENLAEEDLTYDDIFTNLSNKILTKSDKKSKKISSSIGSSIISLDKIKAGDSEWLSKVKFSVIGATLIFYDRNDEKRQIDALSGRVRFGQDKIAASGKFGSEDSINDFNLSLVFNSDSKKPDSFLKIFSPFSAVVIDGNISSGNEGFMSSFKGKVSVEILDLREFYRSYLNNNEAAFGKIKSSSKPITISGEIDLLDGEMGVGNMVIDSDLLKGRGEAAISLNQKNLLVDVSLDLDRVDIDSIWSSDPVKFEIPTLDKLTSIFGIDNIEDVVVVNKNEAKKVEGNVEKSSIVEDEKKEEVVQDDKGDSSKIIKNIYLAAEIQAKEVVYRGTLLTDAQTYLTLSPKKELMILPMTIRVPGEGLFRISGVFDGSVAYPKFVGHCDMSGSRLKDLVYWFDLESQNFKPDNLGEYVMFADVLMIPNLMKFGNVYLSLNKDQSKIIGDFEIDNSDKIPLIVSNLKVSSINLDDYYISSNSNSYLSSGTLLTKLLWLNDIGLKNKVNIFFENVVYQNKKYRDQSFKATVSRGYVNIDEFSLKNDEFDFKSSLKIDISNESPLFELKIDSPYFYHKTPAPAPIKDEKGNLVQISTFRPKTIFERFFSLPSFEGFKGNVILNFKDLEVDDFVASNLTFGGAINNGEISNAQFEADMYDGHLSCKGLLSLKGSKVINGNITLSNANVEWLLSDIINCEEIDGVTNITANLNSVGTSKKEFLGNLRGVVNFGVSAPKVDSYGINSLISKMIAPVKYAQELKDPEKILFNEDDHSLFKAVNGSIDFDGDKGSKISAKVAGTAINSVLSGKIDPANNSGDLNYNSIFLVGTKQKPVPINISTNLKGDFSSMAHSTNLDQVKQYLGLMKVPPKPKVAEEVPDDTKKETEANSADNADPAVQQISQKRINDIVKKSSLINVQDMGVPAVKLPPQDQLPPANQ